MMINKHIYQKTEKNGRQAIFQSIKEERNRESEKVVLTESDI